MINVITTNGGVIDKNHLFKTRDKFRAEALFIGYAKEIDPDLNVDIALEEGYVDHENIAGRSVMISWPEEM